MENKMIVKCQKGHYYDKNAYNTCPYCLEGGTIPISIGTDKYKGDENGAVSSHSGSGSTIPFNNGGETIPLDGYKHKPAPGGDASTIPMNPGGGTRPVKASAQQGRRDTVAISERTFGMDPVVGWIVCINGFNKGRSFIIHSDRNIIGRGEGNDICIQGDQSISYDHDSAIVYDRKSRIFMFVPGDGRAVSYVNDSAALVPTQLKIYDKITIGETDFLFVPFCGKDFDWQ